MVFEAIKAFLFGIVEGITEWLPISSTGHMMLLNQFVQLDVSAAFYDTFLVVVQLGAIMAVIILFFRKLNPFSLKKTREERRNTWGIWARVVIGTIPAGIVGVLLDDWMEEHIMNSPNAYVVVSCTLIIYGIIFIILERVNRKREAKMRTAAHATEESLFDVNSFEEMSFSKAFIIGIFQSLAVIPGTSRSGAIIIGSMLSGTSRTIATEFAFFLAIPIMFGWSLVKLLKHGLAFTGAEWLLLGIGTAVSFAVSILAIRFLVGYVKKNDFTAFGWYRIILGVLVLGYFGSKALGLW